MDIPRVRDWSCSDKLGIPGGTWYLHARLFSKMESFSVKTAVVLTGQLRTIEHTKKVIRDTFPDADFFLSIDRDNRLQCAGLNQTDTTEDQAVQRVIEYFQPRGVYVNSGLPEDYRSPDVLRKTFRVTKYPEARSALTYQDYRQGRVFSKRGRRFHRFFHRLEDALVPWVHPKLRGLVFDGYSYLVEVPHTILFEQYFYVHQGFQLVKSFEKTSGQLYSTVVRLRFDQLVFGPETYPLVKDHTRFTPENLAFMERFEGGLRLDFSSLGDRDIVVFGFGSFHHYYMVCDQHFVVNRQGFEALTQFYPDLHGLVMKCVEENAYPTHEARIEHFFARWLSQHGFSLRNATDLGYGGMFIRALA